jgi:DNA polymerase/3'-5' exonuclease PolX
MNEKIIDEFKKLISYFQLLYENEKDTKEKIKSKFRIESIKRGLKIISKYPKKIVKDDKEFSEIEGIGKGIIARVNEIIYTGKLSEIQTNKKVMEGMMLLEQLTDVIGIGPILAKKLIKQYNIKSVEDLIERNKIGEIKLNDKLLMGLKYYGVYKKDIPRKEIDQIKEYIINLIKEYYPEYIITFCGSYRRGKYKSNDIDILITNKKDNKKNNLKIIIEILRDKKFLVDDLTDRSPITKYMGFCKYKNNPIRRIDIRYMPYENYYTALLYFTGSDDLNKKMRYIARKMNYKLNEYGIYKIEIKNDKMVEKKIKVESEKDIFDILKIEYLKPEQR